MAHRVGTPLFKIDSKGSIQVATLPRSVVIVLLSRADLLDKNHLPHSALPLRSYAADVHNEDFAKSDQSPSTPPRALIKRRHRNRPIGLAVS